MTITASACRGRAPQAAIAKAYEIPPGRFPADDSLGMYRRILHGALEEWGLRPSDVDGVFAPPAGIALGGPSELFTHEKLCEELGINVRVGETISAGGATFSLMVQRAALLITDGYADAILCVGAGKFPDVGAGAAESMARIVSHPDFEFIYGAFIPAIYALAASQYMAETGASEYDLARVAVSARRWALRNPDAVMHCKGEISVDDVISSRPIASPFHLLDCSVPCEGGGAVLVTGVERARQLARQPAYILGFGEYHTHNCISQCRDLVRTGAGPASRQAFERAGITPAEIDMVQLYDAFSVNPLILLDDLGFTRRGQAAALVNSGATDPGGALPMNTNGGLLSFGHTGDASGMSVLVEGVRQVMGSAGAHQVDGIETTFVHTYGGMMAEHASLVLGRTAP
ncbi:thiolase family protein [Mycobacterium sp. CVI_P3]|uniref:Thiolase family protein n=1 Tax=Mycobacterium pinniadriaticum TaxID=2994102 RepID=A0ABT3SMF9_9MYCO|nr:thiolase family protein [Mycobacterium pinniadriaticum]MCX2934253.1 thiolase family protein [Mycobacterium pinniadriaticum]MCX2940710.1 thiolase family protein [Mycobacterium pinniadriaticum]